MADTTSGYINGSDLLLSVGGGAIGHCTTHTLTFGTETKERAVKPVASETSLQSGLWQNKGVSKLTISVSAEGLRFYGETEKGFTEISALWGAGQSVELIGKDRSGSVYLQGKFVITQIEETSPAQDDATYSVSLENDGEPDVYPGKSSSESSTTTA